VHRQQAAGAFGGFGWIPCIGMSASKHAALFMMIAAAATLTRWGLRMWRVSTQAAQALRPLGRLAFFFFSIGIMGRDARGAGAGGSAAYAVGEALEMAHGAGSKAASGDRGFMRCSRLRRCSGYCSISRSAALDAIDAYQALFWSAVINGVTAVPIMVVMMAS